MDLSHGAGDVGEVVRGGPAGDDVEGFVAKGQGPCVARDELDARPATAPHVRPRRGQHRLGEIAGDHPVRDGREGERRVAAARRNVEHAVGTPGGAPGQEPIEVLAGRVEGARHVRRRARAELRLDAPRVGVGHFFGVRSAR